MCKLQWYGTGTRHGVSNEVVAAIHGLTRNSRAIASVVAQNINQCKPMELKLYATQSILLQWRHGGWKVQEKPYPTEFAVTESYVLCGSVLLLCFKCVQRPVGHFGQRLGSQKSAVELDVLHGRTNNYSFVEMAPVQGNTPKKQQSFFFFSSHIMNTVEKFKNLCWRLLYCNTICPFFSSRHVQKWCKFSSWTVRQREWF